MFNADRCYRTFGEREENAGRKGENSIWAEQKEEEETGCPTKIGLINIIYIKSII